MLHRGAELLAVLLQPAELAHNVEMRRVEGLGALELGDRVVEPVGRTRGPAPR